MWSGSTRPSPAMTMALPSSLLLPFLPPDLLVRVPHALALVRLGQTERADLRRHLADQALVHALHLDRRRPLAGDLDAVRNLKHHRMRVAEIELEILALYRGTVAGTGDLHRPLIALRHAPHHR